MIPRLETQRLRQREWRQQDLDPYARFCANPQSARFVGGPCTRDEAWRRIALFVGHWTLRGYGNWALEERTTGQFVGYAGLWHPEGWPEPELMWGLLCEYWGRGYATEAGRRARQFGYAERLATALASYIDPHNLPSQKVAARLGAVRESTIELRGSAVGVYRHPARTLLNQ